MGNADQDARAQAALDSELADTIPVGAIAGDASILADQFRQQYAAEFPGKPIDAVLDGYCTSLEQLGQTLESQGGDYGNYTRSPLSDGWKQFAAAFVACFRRLDDLTTSGRSADAAAISLWNPSNWFKAVGSTFDDIKSGVSDLGSGLTGWTKWLVIGVLGVALILLILRFTKADAAA